VLEETVGTSPTMFYTIGDDVLGRCINTGPGRRFMVYDGHGSVRQITRGNGTELESYCYDGYGVLLQDDSESLAGTTPEQLSRLLYAGEYFDANAQMYYNRARWYNPYNGRFNRTDPFAGNMQDPQSLHKYLYCHANPINGIDPSGEFFIGSVVSFVAMLWTQAKMLGMRTADAVRTYIQYSRAKQIMTAIGVGLVIGQAAMSYLTGGVSVELVFQDCLLIPNRKKWPNIKFEFSYRHGVNDMFSKMSKLKISISKKKVGDLDEDIGGNVSIGVTGTFIYDFIQRKSDMSGDFRSGLKIPLYKKGPLQLLSLLTVKYFGLNTSGDDSLEAGVTWDLGLEVGPANTNWTLLEIMPPNGKILGVPL
jgi:RHS repeat-associated protein